MQRVLPRQQVANLLCCRSVGVGAPVLPNSCCSWHRLRCRSPCWGYTCVAKAGSRLCLAAHCPQSMHGDPARPLQCMHARVDTWRTCVLVRVRFVFYGSTIEWHSQLSPPATCLASVSLARVGVVCRARPAALLLVQEAWLVAVILAVSDAPSVCVRVAVGTIVVVVVSLA